MEVADDSEDEDQMSSCRSLDLAQLILDTMNNNSEALDLEDYDSLSNDDVKNVCADLFRGKDAHATPEEALPRPRARECGSGAACTAATGQRLAAPDSADKKRSGAAVGGRNLRLPQDVVWHQTPDAVHIRVVFATLRDIQAGALKLKQDEASLQFSFTEIGKQGSGGHMWFNRSRVSLQDPFI
jgi:hypothetical protein